MCGINGILNYPGHDLNRRVQAMNDRIAHRGPDDEGIYCGVEIGLGHRRLAIIDLSADGHQPMWCRAKRYVIVFNGEIYNYREIKQELSGYSFQTKTDTEVILAAWTEWKEKCLEKLNGMFAFAIWDTQDKSLFIARDRLGIKPLYYHYSGTQLVFSSEIRGILSSGLVEAKLNREVLHEYFTYQTVHAPRTLVKEVHMLMPGHYMVLKSGDFHMRQWWSPAANRSQESKGKSYAEVCSDIHSLLRSAVERRLVSDVPFGAFLSGGIDSSAVVGMMSRIMDRPVKTFTISFDEKEFSESVYAAEVAQRFGTEHHELKLSPADFLAELPQALAALDHPSGDGPNSYIVSKITRENGVTMALSGLGGDELFAGYPVFKRTAAIERWKSLYYLPLPLRKVIAGVLKSIKPGITGTKMAQMLSLPGADLYHTFPLSRQVGAPEHVNQLTQGDPSLNDPLHEIIRKEIGNMNMPLYSQVSIAEICGYMQNVLLRDTDQMSMRVALEVRVPFLDYKLVEYVLGVNDAFKHPVYPKKLLVDSLQGLLPDSIVHRKKMGFVFPWALWLRGELKDLCADSIQSLQKREFLDSAYLANSWKAYQNNDPNIRWLDLWLCVVLEKWMQSNSISS